MVLAEACDPSVHERTNGLGCHESLLVRCHGEIAAPTVREMSGSDRGLASEGCAKRFEQRWPNGSLLAATLDKGCLEPE